MARLYANENFARQVVESLRARGHNVLTSHEAGNAGRSVSDPDVLQFAISENRAVVTFNRRHFVKLHARVPTHCGIVVCSYDPDFSALSSRVHDAISTAGGLRGKLIRVNRPG
jgi:hypothetical protein